jgi:hypothetical protein
LLGTRNSAIGDNFTAHRACVFREAYRMLTPGGAVFCAYKKG